MMTIEERLRKFLLMRGYPIGSEFSGREVRECVRLLFGGTRNDEVRRMFTEDLLFMIIEYLTEKEE